MCAYRVVDEIEHQVAFGVPIADLVELPQGRDAEVERSLSPLLVYIVFEIAGKTGYDFDSMFSKEGDEVLLIRLEQYTEIAAVDHAQVELGGCAHQRPEGWVQLWRSTRKVQNFEMWRGLHQSNQAVGRRRGHALCALWSGADMAVLASLIAHFTDVDLQPCDLGRCQWGEAGTL